MNFDHCSFWLMQSLQKMWNFNLQSEFYESKMCQISLKLVYFLEYWYRATICYSMIKIRKNDYERNRTESKTAWISLICWPCRTPNTYLLEGLWGWVITWNQTNSGSEFHWESYDHLRFFHIFTSHCYR